MNKIPLLMALACMIIVSSCNKEDDEPMLRSQVFEYSFNDGQLVGPATSYVGEHPRNLSARMEVMEMPNGMAKIMVTLNNTMAGQMYMIHAHDMADPDTTPNGTPYNETPNANVLSEMVTPQGTTAMVEHLTMLTYDQLLQEYDGFLVVHDPTQPLSTTDLTTYLILGVVAR
ncbi:hypothetical protein EL17_03500 [Anditalea andensis]|uniref:CHRD domain-containing protein n=2 Tax=Anditalea andensis TaxID=1048983 RepID=A0A074L0S5_9BACT|nr:hypothetical protein EL17_03500 [Anditalea andensis]